MKKIALIAPLLMLLIAGCSKHGEAGKSGSQVVARVNGSELTVHQLNFALSKMGKLDQSQLKAASEKVLQQMVEMELLKQKAVEAKLDRDPRILQMLEDARQQVLAQAYMQKIASRPIAPSGDEIRKFYDTHPELFSERQVYGIQEFVVKEGNAHASEIEAGIHAARTAEDVSKWLKDNHYVFNANASRKAAEQLPLDLLKQLNTLKVGDTVVVRSPDALVLLFLAKIDREPIDLEQAQPAIQRYLVNASQQALVKNEVAALRKQANVEFLGDFSTMASNMAVDSGEESASGAAPVAANPQATVSQVAVTPEAESDPPTHNPAIEKGLAGLQ